MYLIKLLTYCFYLSINRIRFVWHAVYSNSFTFKLVQI